MILSENKNFFNFFIIFLKFDYTYYLKLKINKYNN